MFDSSTNSTGPRFRKKCDRLECEEKTGNPSVSTKLQIRAGQCAWYPKPILLTVSSRSSGGPCNLTWHLNKKNRSHVVFRSLCWKLNSSPCVRFRFCLNMQRNYFVYIYIWRFNIYLLIYCTYEIHYELLIIAVPINFYWILYLDNFHLLFLKCVTKSQYSLYTPISNVLKRKGECLCWAITCRFDKKFFSDKT